MIEPGIQPLVNAINYTCLFKTFSSCEGHFEANDQTIDDRTKAAVRFELLKKSSLKNAEQFIHYVIEEFGNGILPCCLRAYKLYVPKVPGQKHFVFVIEIIPVNRFNSPGIKRQITDRGIKRTVRIIKRYRN